MTDPRSEDEIRRTLFWMGRVRELTPFSPVVQRAMATLDDERSSARDLAAVLSQDEALVASLLRVVNSALFGLRGRVTTISQAVPLLGFSQLRMVIVGVALFEQRRIRDPFAEKNRLALWEHSSLCARWATGLAAATRYQPVEEASVSAMLHDIGKIVLGESSPVEFMASTRLIRTEGLDSCEAEERVLGINHIVVGQMVAEHWRFPPIVRSALAHHHDGWPPPVDDAGPQEVQKALHLQAILRVANSASKQPRPAPSPDLDMEERDVAIAPEELRERAWEVDDLLRSC